MRAPPIKNVAHLANFPHTVLIWEICVFIICCFIITYKQGPGTYGSQDKYDSDYGWTAGINK